MRPLRVGALLAGVCLLLVLGAWMRPQQQGDVQFIGNSAFLSSAVRVGNTLYLSGQIGVEPGTTNVVAGGIQAEAKQAMQNIKTSLEANGYALNNLVKCTVMLADMKDWPAFNDAYKAFFPDHYPARSAFGANGLALGARVEIECIAAADK